MNNKIPVSELEICNNSRNEGICGAHSEHGIDTVAPAERLLVDARDLESPVFFDECSAAIAFCKSFGCSM